ncbi:hypothetical protein QOT17_017758 [Balamuthia mandrillaris]
MFFSAHDASSTPAIYSTAFPASATTQGHPSAVGGPQNPFISSRLRPVTSPPASLSRGDLSDSFAPLSHVTASTSSTSAMELSPKTAYYHVHQPHHHQPSLQPHYSHQQQHAASSSHYPQHTQQQRYHLTSRPHTNGPTDLHYATSIPLSSNSSFSSLSYSMNDGLPATRMSTQPPSSDHFFRHQQPLRAYSYHNQPSPQLPLHPYPYSSALHQSSSSTHSTSDPYFTSRLRFSPEQGQYEGGRNGGAEPRSPQAFSSWPATMSHDDRPRGTEQGGWHLARTVDEKPQRYDDNGDDYGIHGRLTEEDYRMDHLLRRSAAEDKRQRKTYQGEPLDRSSASSTGSNSFLTSASHHTYDDETPQNCPYPPYLHPPSFMVPSPLNVEVDVPSEENDEAEVEPVKRNSTTRESVFRQKRGMNRSRSTAQTRREKERRDRKRKKEERRMQNEDEAGYQPSREREKVKDDGVKETPPDENREEMREVLRALAAELPPPFVPGTKSTTTVSKEGAAPASFPQELRPSPPPRQLSPGEESEGSSGNGKSPQNQNIPGQGAVAQPQSQPPVPAGQAGECVTARSLRESNDGQQDGNSEAQQQSQQEEALQKECVIGKNTLALGGGLKFIQRDPQSFIPKKYSVNLPPSQQVQTLLNGPLSYDKLLSSSAVKSASRPATPSSSSPPSSSSSTSPSPLAYLPQHSHHSYPPQHKQSASTPSLSHPPKITPSYPPPSPSAAPSIHLSYSSLPERSSYQRGASSPSFTCPSNTHLPAGTPSQNVFPPPSASSSAFFPRGNESPISLNGTSLTPYTSPSLSSPSMSFSLSQSSSSLASQPVNSNSPLIISSASFSPSSGSATSSRKAPSSYSYTFYSFPSQSSAPVSSSPSPSLTFHTTNPHTANSSNSVSLHPPQKRKRKTSPSLSPTSSTLNSSTVTSLLDPSMSHSTSLPSVQPLVATTMPSPLHNTIPSTNSATFTSSFTDSTSSSLPAIQHTSSTLSAPAKRDDMQVASTGRPPPYMERRKQIDGFHPVSLRAPEYSATDNDEEDLRFQFFNSHFFDSNSLFHSSGSSLDEASPPQLSASSSAPASASLADSAANNNYNRNHSSQTQSTPARLPYHCHNHN